jgi:hypothetical protein
MGDTHPQVVLPVLASTGIRYYPFPGEVVGHPSALAGTTDAIVESACRLAAMEACTASTSSPIASEETYRI